MTFRNVQRITYFVMVLTLVYVAQAQAQFLGIGGDREPRELENLKKQNIAVPVYESFDEIAALTPVPAAFRLRLGAVFRMLVLRKQELRYDIVSEKDYNALEKTINGFFNETGSINSLKLLNYARQIDAGHPYRVNPFVPYFTIRSENQLIADENTGPAAVVADLFSQRGRIEGTIHYMTLQGEHRSAEVRYRERSLPNSGLLFLFNHDVFPLDELIKNPKENILQDVILHEFTHIWHNELLTERNRNKLTVGANMTENGHDTMIVTNPAMGFLEGLAIGFEALYGSMASQLLNMSADERRQFFGRFSDQTRAGLEFLANRQGYVRRNSYIYNLYDFNDCTLRVVNSPSSSDLMNIDSSLTDLLASVRRGDRIPLDRLNRVFSWREFDNRFYSGDQRVSTVHLMNHCQDDSPARLESKEGFIATLIYNLMYSGALVDSAVLDFDRLGLSTPEGKKDFIRYLTESSQWEQLWSPEVRGLASENPRVRRAERIFLLGFRNLVKAVKGSQAVTTKDFLQFILGPQSPFDQGVQLKVAYQVMKVTKGLWFNPKTPAERRAISFFQSPASMRDYQTDIVDFLLALADDDRLVDVAAQLGKTPDVFVSFPSQFAGGGNRRINVNLAYHIDLIDMFGMNNEAIAELAQKLDEGPVFSNAQEFLRFAGSIGKEAQAVQWVAKAQEEIKEVSKLEHSFRIQDLRNTHFDRR